MTCVCGHSDDLHKYNVLKEKSGSCMECECKEFSEDIDRDELEVE